MEQTSTTTHRTTMDDVAAAAQLVTGQDTPAALWAAVQSWSVAEWLGAVEAVGADEPDLSVVTAVRDGLRRAVAASR